MARKPINHFLVIFVVNHIQNLPGLAGYEVYSQTIISITPCNVLHSETAPTEGTLEVFPDVGLSNAYIMLRPFFQPRVPLDDPEILDAKNWQYGMSLGLHVRVSLNSLAQILPQQTFLVFTPLGPDLLDLYRSQNHIRISGWSRR